MRISKRTKFQIDKILSTRVRRGIQEYLVRWKGYGPDFDSWINATSVKNIQEMEYRKHFYITLFSNSSQKTNPANTLTEFRIQLAQPIDLGSTDNWEVGLCEFSCPPYPHTVKPYELAGEIKALVYCVLITQQFVGSDYVRCLRTFIHPTK